MHLRTLLSAAFIAIAAQPSAAQQPLVGAGRTWLELGRAGGSRVALDSASLARSDDSTFVAITLVHFPDTLTAPSGARFDREIDLQELSCTDQRLRSYRSQLLLRDSLVLEVPMRTAWRAVAEPELPLFRARCAFLVGSFVMRRPKLVDVSVVEERPTLTNAPRVASLIAELVPQTGPGTMVVAFVVDERGQPLVETLHVISSDIANAEPFARRVVDRMRFRSARINRRGVAVRVQLPITFGAN